jgi:hypothetical protein
LPFLPAFVSARLGDAKFTSARRLERAIYQSRFLKGTAKTANFMLYSKLEERLRARGAKFSKKI